MSAADTDAPSPEHSRYEAFVGRLTALERLPDALLESLIAEAASDPDATMGGSVLALIADHSLLSEDQRAALFSHPQYQQSFLQHRLRRATLLRLLRTPSPSEDLIQQCLSFADAPVQRALLDHPALSHSHLVALREHGTNRAIRNIATQRLGTRPHS